VNAKQKTYSRNDALALLRGVDQLFAAKGKKIVHFNLKKDKPDTETLEKMILGPTGNLRAPTLRMGKTLIVGFNEEMYEQAGL
jgi:arsenate reductase-like glutaredoxin family protein